jgi:hypothetical protein
MATRMQQRRGTAAQWTSANPILAGGEIGFETDTGQFKIGNGSSAWSALSYFKDTTDGASSFAPLVNGLIPIQYLANLIDGADANKDTLRELGDLAVTLNTSIGNVSSNLTSHESDSVGVHGISDTANLVYAADLTAHNADTTDVHGIADTSVLVVTSALNSAISTEVNDRNTAISGHNADTTDVHGIADTSVLVVTSALNSAISTEVNDRNTAISDHNNDQTNVHGIADTSLLVTTTMLSAHSDDTTSVHGIADTSALATKTYADNAADAAETAAINEAGTAADGKVSTHNALTTNVHGIADTAALATKNYADNAVSTHEADTTSVHGIADTSALATKTYADSAVSTAVSALTKSSVGLGNVDNTSDADKPISTATQTALDLKAPLASPTFTGTPSAPTPSSGDNTTKIATTAFVSGAVADLVASAPAALNTLNELATALGNDASFSTTITNSIATKAPIASPTFTGTVTVAASGIAFTDGTQTKEGVPSRTTITQATGAYNLSTSGLSLRDGMLEVSHTGGTAVDITIPANSTTAYPVGTSIDILRTNTGGVRIVGAAGVTVNATPGAFLRAQWSAATLFKRATDTWVVIGDLATA